MHILLAADHVDVRAIRGRRKEECGQQEPPRCVPACDREDHRGPPDESDKTNNQRWPYGNEKNWASEVGFTGGTNNPISRGLPQLSASGYIILGPAYDLPKLWSYNNYQYAAALTWIVSGGLSTEFVTALGIRAWRRHRLRGSRGRSWSRTHCHRGLRWIHPPLRCSAFGSRCESLY